MNLKEFIKVYNIFSKDECSNIISYTETDWTPHEWYDPVSNQRTVSHSDPSIAIVDYTTSNKICNKVMNSTLTYFDELGQKNVVSNLSRPRLNKYVVGQEMKVHNDHIQSLFDGNQKGIPILSYILMLSDDFEGGEFVFKFINEEYEVKLISGDLIIWPSIFLYPHEVKPVTKGERISTVVWGW